MISLENYSLTHSGNTIVTVPQVTVACKVIDSRTKTEKGDFSGIKSLTWPAVMATLTVGERKEVMETIISKVLEIKLRNL